jgi:multicomponent Na+:H+ antiporter subunit B
LKAFTCLIMAVFAGIIIYVTGDLPPYGTVDTPASEYLAPYYIEQSEEEIGVSNLVTAVLADYRSYDTLGETAVIFTAGVALLLVLMRGSKRD